MQPTPPHPRPLAPEHRGEGRDADGGPPRVNRRILLQVAGPAVGVGLLLLAVCLVSAWQINRLQANMSHLLQRNVASLAAAQELEIQLRRLRFHSFIYLLDPVPARL